MRTVLAGFAVVLAASWLGVSCSSSPSNNPGTGTGGSSGSGTGGASAGSGGASAGTGGSGAGECMVPKLVRDNTTVACGNCLQARCCAKINACWASPDCLNIYKCQSSCYDGRSPDGGILPEDDAGVRNDAGNIPRDQCAEDCVNVANKPAVDLFKPMEECWIGFLPGQCGEDDVCD